MGIFATIGQTLTDASEALINGSISNITSAVTPVVLTGVTVYFMITGYMVLAGRISEPIADVCIKAFKIALMSSIALNSGNISAYIVNGVNGIEQMFVNAITGDGSVNTFQKLDDIFNKCIEAAAKSTAAAEKLDIWDMGEIIALNVTSGIIVISASIMSVIAGAIILMAKISLSILFGVSPFFLAGWIFPVTARWADAWLNQALNYSLVSAIVIFIMSFAVKLFDAIIDVIIAEIDAGGSFPIGALGELIVVSCLVGWIIGKAPSLAAGLAGGASSAGASLAGIIGRSTQTGAWIDSAKGAAIKDAKWFGKAVQTTKNAPVTVSRSVERLRRNQIRKY